ncbi:uncharacterized protein LOC123880050 isoform X2 [Maniola jurtina]|uniref:uncharacterized protein LOC123880050 isoform X2 n=1 Tax=Maniola jurtina TaxID=191418 RepID=UPI001E688EE2|nr:uncharacterized protein LOC123880050 isoform X2 [Maniola jurtina]
MEKNYNFETILKKFERLSVVDQQLHHKETIALTSMSAESPNHELKNKDDESALLAPEHSGSRVWVSAGAVAAASELPVPAPVGGNPEYKHDLLNSEKDDDQEASGDKDKKSKEDEPHIEKDRDREEKSEKEKGDNVDSVFLRSPPAHKRAASASPPQEEDCGIKCLYYTLQCCDCVLM